MNLSNLPSELLVSVFICLDHADLKSIHLTSKRLSEIVTSILFYTIHLTPNTLSYDRALQVVSSKTHKKHVRAITYHVGLLYNDFEGFDDFKKELPLLNRREFMKDPQAMSEKMLWYYSCWLEEVDAQTNFECRDELQALTDLCSRIPNLERISTTMDGYTDIVAEPTDYIGRRTGMQSGLQSEGPHFLNLFLATCNLPLNSISGRSLSWDTFLSLAEAIDLSQVKCLKTLNHLELGLFNWDFFKIITEDSQEATEILSAFSEFLRASSNVNHLTLDFDELPYEARSDTLSPIYDTVFPIEWTQLRSLELKGLAVDESQLTEFLLRQHQTLHTLHLGDIDLISRTRRHKIEDDNTSNTETTTHRSQPDTHSVGSIISLFDTISTGLRLKHVHLTGNFINRVDEAWYVNPDHHQQKHDCIVYQLQAYLCQRAPSPFPRTFLAQRKRWPAKLHGGMWHFMAPDTRSFVDDSWVWCPEMIG